MSAISQNAPIKDQDVSQAQAAQSNLEIAGMNLSNVMMILSEAQNDAKDLGNTIKEKKKQEPKLSSEPSDEEINALKAWQGEVASLQADLQQLFDKIATIEGQLAVAQQTVDHIRNVEMPKASEKDRERLEQETERLSKFVDKGKANIAAMTDNLQADGGSLLRSVTQKTDMEIDVDVTIKLTGGRTTTFKVDTDFQLSVKRLSLALDQVGGMSGAARGAGAQSSGLLTGSAQSRGVYQPGSAAEATALNGLRDTIATSVQNTNLNDPKAVQALSSDLEAKFASVVAKANVTGGNVDVAALVEYVLMQAYNASTQDMYVFAKKVEHFNKVKKALNDEITRVRAHLSKHTDTTTDSNGKTPDNLRAPFQTTNMASAAYGTFGTDIDPNDKSGNLKSSFKQNAANTNVKKDVEAYLARLEEKKGTIGDDAQVANLELQQFVQKQQQVLQLMSNLYKLFHETAMAIIRKIGG